MSASAQGTPVPSVVHLPHNVELPIIFYRNQPVITFAMMDKAHQRPAGTAHRNFKANRSKLIEGEDYFRRNSSEAKQELGITAPNGLILLTQTGYLMLAKSFTDDLAWQVQRELVKNYFRSKQDIPSRHPNARLEIEVRTEGEGQSYYCIKGVNKENAAALLSAIAIVSYEIAEIAQRDTPAYFPKQLSKTEAAFALGNPAFGRFAA